MLKTIFENLIINAFEKLWNNRFIVTPGIKFSSIIKMILIISQADILCQF